MASVKHYLPYISSQAILKVYARAYMELLNSEDDEENDKNDQKKID